MGEEVVLYRLEGSVAVLTLNRPDRMNAWNAELEERYLALLEQTAADPGVRAVVVTGTGRGYCPGADMSELRVLGDAGTRPIEELQSVPVSRTYASRSQSSRRSTARAPASGSHKRSHATCALRRPAVKFTTSYARRGLVAEDGTSWLLPPPGPLERARPAALARIVLAEEALQLGLVNASSRRRTCSGTRSSTPRISLRIARRRRWRGSRSRFTVISTTSRAAIAESAPLVVASLATDDFREGVASFSERRPPRFSPLAFRVRHRRRSGCDAASAADEQHLTGDVRGGGDARWETVAATSSGSPIRPAGNQRDQPLQHLGGMPSVIGVAISPGATAFTRTSGAQRSARARVKPIRPDFAAT